MVEEVVERPQYQRDVVGVVLGVQRAGVTDPGRETGGRGFFDMARYGVDEVNVIAVLQQPSCVSPGAGADVDDSGGAAGRWRLRSSWVRTISRTPSALLLSRSDSLMVSL